MPRKVSGYIFDSPSPEIRERVENRLKECEEILCNGMPFVPFKFQVLYNLRGKTAGLAYGYRRLIRLNIDLLNDPRYVDDMIFDTVAHEYAHLVVFEIDPFAKSHGLEWKRVMRLLGVPANRCHDYEVAAARKQRKWSYRCNCMQHNVSTMIHNRISRDGRDYYCKDCGSKIVKI